MAKQQTRPAPAKAPQRPQAAPPAKTTAVAPVQGGAMVVDEMPDYLRNQQHAARGSENVGVEDLAIPRLEIVQGLSPAIKPQDPGYIPGAKMGDLINSVTRMNYGGQVAVVPVYFQKQWLVWKDQNKGGGFFGAYNTPHEAAQAAEEAGGEAGFIQVIDTPQHIVLVLDLANGKASEMIIPMPRTKAKISRQWNSMIKLIGGDRFSRVYMIGSASEKNDKGDYYNYTVAQSGFPQQSVYKQAEALYNSFATGERKVVMNVDGLDPGEGTVINNDEM